MSRDIRYVDSAIHIIHRNAKTSLALAIDL